MQHYAWSQVERTRDSERESCLEDKTGGKPECQVRVYGLLGLLRQDNGQIKNCPIQMLLATQEIQRVEEALKTDGRAQAGHS